MICKANRSYLTKGSEMLQIEMFPEKPLENPPFGGYNKEPCRFMTLPSAG
jgi:hypothetical protein